MAPWALLVPGCHHPPAIGEGRPDPIEVSAPEAGARTFAYLPPSDGETCVPDGPFDSGLLRYPAKVSPPAPGVACTLHSWLSAGAGRAAWFVQVSPGATDATFRCTLGACRSPRFSVGSGTPHPRLEVSTASETRGPPVPGAAPMVDVSIDTWFPWCQDVSHAPNSGQSSGQMYTVGSVDDLALDLVSNHPFFFCFQGRNTVSVRFDACEGVPDDLPEIGTCQDRLHRVWSFAVNRG